MSGCLGCLCRVWTGEEEENPCGYWSVTACAANKKARMNLSNNRVPPGCHDSPNAKQGFLRNS
jgi:hypothetical protein